MKKKNFLRKVLFLFVLTAAIGMLTACGMKVNINLAEDPKTEAPSEEALEIPEDAMTAASESSDAFVTEVGTGKVSFPFTVCDKDGNTADFIVHTDKAIVGDALLDCGLIEGEEGPYGLYVKTVNGITADYDKDGVYWAFYVNGEYGMSGVDLTEIDPDAEYMFKVE